MLAACLTLAFMVVVTLAAFVAVGRWRRLLADHEAALALMREQLKLFDLISQRQGDADCLFIRHQAGTDSTWVDLVLTAPGISLRMPIQPEEMEALIADLRGQSTSLS